MAAQHSRGSYNQFKKLQLSASTSGNRLALKPVNRAKREGNNFPVPK